MQHIIVNFWYDPILLNSVQKTLALERVGEKYRHDVAATFSSSEVTYRVNEVTWLVHIWPVGLRANANFYLAFQFLGPVPSERVTEGLKAPLIQYLKEHGLLNNLSEALMSNCMVHTT